MLHVNMLQLQDTETVVPLAVQHVLNEGERLIVLPTDSAMISNVSEISHLPLVTSLVFAVLSVDAVRGKEGRRVGIDSGRLG